MGEWVTKKLKEIAIIKMGQSPESLYVNEVGIGVPFLQGNAEFSSLYPKNKYWVIKPTRVSKTEDILLSVRAPVGETNIADREYCIGRGLSSIEFHIDKKFGWYLINKEKRQLKVKERGSTFTAVNKKDIETIDCFFPEEKIEQSKIAEILTTIDNTIEQTEKIIAKYRRIKQGLLQDLLTKGIDENGNIRSEATHEFKDSPLGRIPVEWEIKSFFDVCSVINGRAFKPEEWSEQGLPIVRIENLNNNNAKYNYCNFRVPNKYYIDNGELLLSWSGTPGTSFGVFIWNRGKAILNQHIFIVKIKHCIRKEFFYYYYNHVVLDEMIRQSHGGVGLQHVTKEDLKRINFVVPKIEEQERVIQIAKTIDDSIETEKKYLSKLKSIKQGLMQDLLTGKVRVTHLLDKGGKSDECHP